MKENRSGSVALGSCVVICRTHIHAQDPLLGAHEWRVQVGNVVARALRTRPDDDAVWPVNRPEAQME
jgi:hypothetical protein